MAIDNYMHTNAINHSNPTDELKTRLAHDSLEVRGFGMPITVPIAKDMCDIYFREWKKCWSIVQKIKDEPAYDDLKNHPDFDGFDRILNPQNQTVSGVFGKEIILQILAQRNCEGIRYVLGTGPDGKNTLIILGVSQVKDEHGRDARVIKNGREMALSTPLVNDNNFPTPADILGDPPPGEVHLHSLTMAEASSIWPDKFTEGYLSDIVFGTY